MHRNMRRMAALTGLIALAGSALAQQGGADRFEGSLDRPLRAAQQAQPPATVQSGYVYMAETDGATRYEVEVRDGVVTAKINGREVPAERVRQGDGTIDLLDRDGKVLKTFNVRVVAGPMPPALGVRPGMPIVPAPPAIEGMLVEPPRTMVGVRMSDETGEVVIDDVIDGLPAARAGVQVGDVVVSLGGKAIKSAAEFRAELKDRNPGDKVEIVVRREGAERTLALTLDAYDTTRLGLTAVPAEGEWKALTERLNVLRGDGRDMAEEARKALAEALERMKASPAFDGEKLRKDVEQAIQQGLRALERSKVDIDSYWRSVQPGQGRARVLVSPEDGGRAFMIPAPAAPGAPNADVARSLEKITAELERLHQRLSEIERRLPKTP